MRGTARGLWAAMMVAHFIAILSTARLAIAWDERPGHAAAWLVLMVAGSALAGGAVVLLRDAERARAAAVHLGIIGRLMAAGLLRGTEEEFAQVLDEGATSQRDRQ